MTRWRQAVQANLLGGDVLTTSMLTGGYVLFAVAANASFKASADCRSWREILFWQILGNSAGFVSVLIFTALLRHLPLHIAFPVVTGLAVIGVQVVAANWFFQESIEPIQWFGTLLVVIGIVLIGGR